MFIFNQERPEKRLNIQCYIYLLLTEIAYRVVRHKLLFGRMRNKRMIGQEYGNKYESICGLKAMYIRIQQYYHQSQCRGKACCRETFACYEKTFPCSTFSFLFLGQQHQLPDYFSNYGIPHTCIPFLAVHFSQTIFHKQKFFFSFHHFDSKFFPAYILS